MYKGEKTEENKREIRKRRTIEGVEWVLRVEEADGRRSKKWSKRGQGDCKKGGEKGTSKR